MTEPIRGSRMVIPWRASFRRELKIQKRRHQELKLQEPIIQQELTADLAKMSINNFGNMFTPENPANAAPPRLAPSPMQAQQHQVNGNGAGMNGMNVGMPMSAGQQMDVNLLYQKVVELSEVLKENREKTAGIVAGAEELAVSTLIHYYKIITFQIHIADTAP